MGPNWMIIITLGFKREEILPKVAQYQNTICKCQLITNLYNIHNILIWPNNPACPFQDPVYDHFAKKQQYLNHSFFSSTIFKPVSHLITVQHTVYRMIIEMVSSKKNKNNDNWNGYKILSSLFQIQKIHIYNFLIVSHSSKLIINTSTRKHTLDMWPHSTEEKRRATGKDRETLHWPPFFVHHYGGNVKLNQLKIVTY